MRVSRPLPPPRRWRSPLVAAAVLGLATGAPAPAADGPNVDLPRFPSISPDGARIAFSWRGDLWVVASEGGLAARLTSHPGDELRSAWSPDGEHLAFTSTRTGFLNVFVMRPDGTGLRRLTEIDRPCELGGFGVDEHGAPVVTFHSTLEGDVFREHRPYQVSLDGGDLRRVHDAFGSQPAVSRDGGRVAFVRGGYYDRLESRRHYRGAEASDVWLYHRATGGFTRLTAWAGNDRRPRWGGERTLLFLSDRELDCVNLYRMSAADGAADASARLTGFTEDDVQDYDVSADGRRAVLSVRDTLYTLDLDDPNARPVAVELRGPEDSGDDVELVAIGRKVSEAALSPDGTVCAVVAYGEVFVRNVEDDALTRRVTRSAAREKDLAWSPDGRRLYFVNDGDGTESIFAATVGLTRGDVREAVEPPPAGDEDVDEDEEEPGEPDEDEGEDQGEDEGEPQHEDEDADDDADDEDPGSRWRDALTFVIAPVVQRDTDDRAPRPSPDGRTLAFRGVRGDVHLLDLDSGAVRTLVESWDHQIEFRWSPDSLHLAVARADLDFNRDIFILPADGSAPAVNVTRHPDDDQSPRFSADGRILAFVSERVNDQYDVWMVYLDADIEALTPTELAAYYDEAAKAATRRKPLAPRDGDDDDDTNGDEDDDGDDILPLDEAGLDDAFIRVRRLTELEGDETELAMTPGGDRLVFVSSGDDEGVHSIKWDKSERKRIATDASVQSIGLSGDPVLLVTGSGRAATVPPAGGDLEHLDVKDRLRVDLAAQASQKFHEAARALGELFYHPTMNGVDWARLTEKYHALAVRARTAHEFDWVANRLIGELNGSHLFIASPEPPAPTRQAHGRLGTRHRRVEGGFEVTAVLARSPAEKGPMALRAGDVITAVEFEPFGATDTVESRLRGRVGEETALTVRRTDADGAEREITLLLTPIDYRSEAALRYEAWRLENARLVAEWSEGRIGYIHIERMNQPALDVFERDLYAAAAGKDGLVIDVRNNGGGWTTDRILASIMVEEHAYTIPRGADPTATGHYPQPRLFIQRYTQPMNLLCNEKSYSNAEIMSHAFKTLGRGTLVGQQTHGSVISTGGTSLVDGTWVRLPFRGWYLPDGTDMELHGAMPDLLVPQTPEAEVLGEDEQLRAAVSDLMSRLE
jgi:tricorn protease